MKNVELQKLSVDAGKMALGNIWGKEAYRINRAILEIDQHNCAAYTRLAKYYKLKNNMTEAKNMYLMAMKIDPNNRSAFNNLYEMKKDQADSDRVDEIKTAGELFKEGQKSMLKSKYKLAAKLFAKAYSQEPSLVYAVNLAGVYKKLGSYDKIELLYRELLENSPKQADTDDINNKFQEYLVSGRELSKEKITKK